MALNFLNILLLLNHRISPLTFKKFLPEILCNGGGCRERVGLSSFAFRAYYWFNNAQQSSLTVFGELYMEPTFPLGFLSARQAQALSPVLFIWPSVQGFKALAYTCLISGTIYVSLNIVRETSRTLSIPKQNQMCPSKITFFVLV